MNLPLKDFDPDGAKPKSKLKKELAKNGEYKKLLYGDKVLGFQIPKGSMSSITESDQSEEEKRLNQQNLNRDKKVFLKNAASYKRLAPDTGHGM